MTHEPTSTVRARRLRARCTRGVAMVAPVEVGESGVGLLVSNGLLKGHQTRDKKAVRQTRNLSGLPLCTGIDRPDIYKRVAAHAMIGVVKIERRVAMRRHTFECLANA